MSQPNVERIIGQLVTDEAFRRRFAADPQAALRHLTETGLALTPCELRALASIDPSRVSQFADVIDPRLQKSDLRGHAG